MTLASMMALDKNALFCDLVETYGIRDLGSLDVQTTATLAAGLREDARIMRKASGQKHTTDTILLAIIADGISALLFGKGIVEEKPDSILDALTKGPQPKEEEKPTKRKFDTREAFDAARAEILKKYKRE